MAMEIIEGALNLRKGALGGDIVIPYAMVEVAKENSKKMTEAEADALKMLSKTTEAAEAPMPTETREGAPKTAAEAHKRSETVSEELKFMESESGAANRIVQGVL